jgi:hypothetical protein
MAHKPGIIILATMLLLTVSGTLAEERHKEDVNRRPQQQRIFQQPKFQQNTFQRSRFQQPIVQQPSYQQHTVQQNFTQQPNSQQRNIQTPNLSQDTFGRPMKFGQVNIRHETKINVGGTNYSVWRDGDSHRVYRDGYWTTFVGLGVLTPVAIGTAYYYPYAYIDAPASYCDGLTEDGCELEWQPVPTVEGSTEFACVAYCPWDE